MKKEIKKEKTGIELIIDERKHQIEELKFTIEKDIKLRRNGQLLMLAHYIMLSNNDNIPKNGTWSIDYIKQIHLKSRLEQLAIVGALIAAHMDIIINLEKEIKERTEKEISNIENV